MKQKETMIAVGVLDNDSGILLTSHLLGDSTEGRALARFTARQQLLTMKLPALNGSAALGFGYEGHYPRTVRVYRIAIKREEGLINLCKSEFKMIWHISLLSPHHCFYRNKNWKTMTAPKSWGMVLPRTPTKEILL